MKTKTFNEIRRIIYEKSGITLGESKVALVSARIGKRLRALNLPDPESYLHYLSNGNNEVELVHFIDAISTNVTSFFREPDHFVFMAEALKKWSEAGQTRFTIWSAACSSGEEPYTIAITAREALRATQADFRILGTDISTNVLEKCKKGVYRADKVDGLDTRILNQYFSKIKEGSEIVSHRVNDSIRSSVTFSRINLSVTPFPMKGPMDIIFIRNVMIYFDNKVRQALLAEAARLLKPGGYLFVGHSEGLTGLVSDLQLVKSAIYVK